MKLNYKYVLAVMLAVAGTVVLIAGAVSSFRGHLSGTVFACIGAAMVAGGLQVIDNHKAKQ